MTQQAPPDDLLDRGDLAPGVEPADRSDPAAGIRGCVIGYALSVLLTGAAFLAVETDIVYQPAVISALTVLAIAQMGVHLVFFLHVTSGPDNTNNVLALAFGILIVVLVVIGSIWIMSHLDANLMPMHEAPRGLP